MIDVRDRGFLLGDGVFETLLVGNRVACWRDDHLNRMKKAARKLDILFDRERIDGEIDAMLATSASGAHVMRVTLSRGLTLRGLAADGDVPTLSVTLDSYDTALIGKPMNLTKSSIRRNPSSVTDRHKTTSYANNVFAAREAKARGADDALMLNQDGLVACTSMANIFVIKDNALLTPPEQDGVLAGIMRQFVLEAAGGLGFSAHVQSIEPEDLAEADGVFVTNSLRLAAPVHQLDAEELRRGPVSGILQALRKAATEKCGFEFERIAP
jgi:branched-chain amino acid aminotransferase